MDCCGVLGSGGALDGVCESGRRSLGCGYEGVGVCVYYELLSRFLGLHLLHHA